MVSDFEIHHFNSSFEFVFSRPGAILPHIFPGYSLNQIIVWKYPSMTSVHSVNPHFLATTYAIHTQLTTLTGHTYRVLYLGRTIPTSAYHNAVVFCNKFTAFLCSALPLLLRSERVRFAAMSPDGQTIVTGAGDEVGGLRVDYLACLV